MSIAKGPIPVFYPALKDYLAQRVLESDQIPQDRKAELEAVAQYVRQKLHSGQTARLTFICTHNSRRSHLSQIWARVAAAWFGITGVETFSGGTEATTFNPRAVNALQSCGLQIDTDNPTATNPVYRVRYSLEAPPLECFSKVFDQPPNPSTAYCAVMTCSQADDACPLVSGCDLRVAIRYEDPKAADDTPEEVARYAERSRQICREMLYMISQVNKRA
jgi:arsenate reductase